MALLAKIHGSFRGKDIISLDQFSPKDLQILFQQTAKMRDIAVNAKPSDILKGNILTLLFYEPSSRTYGSFAAAVKQLGGQTIDILNPQEFSSVVKGETLEDTVRVFEAYTDAIVIRHPEIGAAKRASEQCKFVPVINAGDGIGEHPTQAFLDLYTIYEKFGRMNNLVGLLAGDVLNSRTIHSLIRGLSLFSNNTLYLLSPKELKLSRTDYFKFGAKGIRIIEIESETEIPKTAHFWYWTRVQKERFSNVHQYEKVKDRFVVTPQLLEQYGNSDMILMDPLPRVKTIDTQVDKDGRAVYLRSQVRNGMYVRMALIALVLGKIS